MLNEINWPHDYLPGTTDNFASNEVIVKDITAKEAFEFLLHTELWNSYYKNSDHVVFKNMAGTILQKDTRFSFETFGFPIEAEVVEFEEPEKGKPGRLAWHGWAEGDEEHRLDVIHAWLFEDLSENRVRILTQESQKGKPAVDLHNTVPDVMNEGHQDWLRGLVKALQEK